MSKIARLRRASNGRSCVRCGASDGTVVRAHYTGIRQHLYGKGRGIKGHDAIAADLCHRCHGVLDGAGPADYADLPLLVRKMIRSEEFLHLCAMTAIRDWEEGVVRCSGS